MEIDCTNEPFINLFTNVVIRYQYRVTRLQSATSTWHICNTW